MATRWDSMSESIRRFVRFRVPVQVLPANARSMRMGVGRLAGIVLSGPPRFQDQCDMHRLPNFPSLPGRSACLSAPQGLEPAELRWHGMRSGPFEWRVACEWQTRLPLAVLADAPKSATDARCSRRLCTRRTNIAELGAHSPGSCCEHRAQALGICSGRRLQRCTSSGPPVDMKAVAAKLSHRWGSRAPLLPRGRT